MTVFMQILMFVFSNWKSLYDIIIALEQANKNGDQKLLDAAFCGLKAKCIKGQ